MMFLLSFMFDIVCTKVVPVASSCSKYLYVCAVHQRESRVFICLCQFLYRAVHLKLLSGNREMCRKSPRIEVKLWKYRGKTLSGITV